MLSYPTSLPELEQIPVRKAAPIRDSFALVQLCNTCRMSWENIFPTVHEDTAHFSVTVHNVGCSIKAWLQQDSFRLACCIPQIHTSSGVLAGRDLWMPLVLSHIGGRAVASTRSDQLLLCLAESQELPRTESPWPFWITCPSAALAPQWRSFS